MIDNIQPLILAGGKGTRLKSIVSDRPKVMAEICGKPFITFLFEQLINDGYVSVFLLTGYMSEFIQKKFKNRYKSLKIIYSNELKPLGTGGAIKNACKNIDKEYLLILNGDTYFETSRNDLNLENDKDYIFCRKQKDISRYGNVIFNENSEVVDFSNEKLVEGYINVGTYLLKKELIQKYQREIFSLENDYLKYSISRNNLFTIIRSGLFIDIGIPNDFHLANQFLKNR